MKKATDRMMNFAYAIESASLCDSQVIDNHADLNLCIPSIEDYALKNQLPFDSFYLISRYIQEMLPYAREIWNINRDNFLRKKAYQEQFEYEHYGWKDHDEYCKKMTEEREQEELGVLLRGGPINCDS